MHWVFVQNVEFFSVKHGGMCNYWDLRGLSWRKIPLVTYRVTNCPVPCIKDSRTPIVTTRFGTCTPSHLAVCNKRFGATKLRSYFVCVPTDGTLYRAVLWAYLAIFEMFVDYRILNMK